MTSLALDFISIKGFKSIESVQQLTPAPVNVLIGANGSGKSNFIEVFSFLHAMREGNLQNYVRRAGGAEQLLHFGSKVTKEIEIKISFSNQKNQYRILLRPTDDDSLYPADERTYFWDKARYTQPYDNSLSSRAEGLEAGL